MTNLVAVMAHAQDPRVFFPLLGFLLFWAGRAISKRKRKSRSKRSNLRKMRDLIMIDRHGHKISKYVTIWGLDGETDINIVDLIKFTNKIEDDLGEEKVETIYKKIKTHLKDFGVRVRRKVRGLRKQPTKAVRVMIHVAVKALKKKNGGGRCNEDDANRA